MHIRLPNTSRPILPVVLYAILALGCLTPHLSSNGDNASYIGLAESLVQGLGYVNTFYPNNPLETQYPPLLPALLTPIIAIFGRNYLLMKLIPLAFGGLGLVAMFPFICKETGDTPAWIAVLLTGVNATYLLYATSILTETLYVFLSACALYATLRLSEKTAPPILHILLAAICLALAFYARTVGATLIIGTGGFLLLKRRFKTCFLLGCAVGLMLAPWAVRSLQVENSYFHQLTKSSAGEVRDTSAPIIDRIARNIPRYAAKEFINLAGGPHIAQTTPYNPIKIMTSLLLATCFTLGLIRRLRNRISLLEVYLLVYLGVFAIWPYHDARFLMPVLPLIFLHIYTGLTALPFISKPEHQKRLSLGGTMILCCLGFATSSILVYHNQTRYYTPEMAHFREICLWAGSHTPSDALILSRKPRLTAAWSGRKAWWYTRGNRLPETDDKGNPIAPTHVLVTEFQIAGVNLSEGFAKLTESTPGKFRMVYQTEKPRVSLYEIVSTSGIP